jgi:hypothetical protein
MRTTLLATAAAILLAYTASAPTAHAADQTVPGAGNRAAAELARRSPLVASSLQRLNQQISTVRATRLREQTEDALFNPATCVVHRANLTEAAKQAILAQLLAAGLYNPADAASITGGVEAGVFPPVRAEGSACPQLPQSFGTAPGSSFSGHQSYPGGLAVHESFNTSSALAFSDNYELEYGTLGADKLPHAAPLPPFAAPGTSHGDLEIDHDDVVAAPMWHDWAKTLVFQWNADGTEFTELNFGGNGQTDDDGAAGDSRTGGHHILSLAESIARNLPASFIVTQASAHSAPTLGNEYKVVNWLRTASIIAQADPVARGYLVADSAGHLRLAPQRAPDTVGLNAAGQTDILVEYEIHNLSDADFVFSIPAITESQVILASLASRYGYDPANAANYNTKYRNPALSFLSGERILVLYTTKGIDAVKAALDVLRARGVI